MKNLLLTISACAFLLGGCSLNKPVAPSEPMSSNVATTQEPINSGIAPLPDGFDEKFAPIFADTSHYESGKFSLKKYIGTRSGHDCSSFVSLVNKHQKNKFYTEREVSKFYDKSGRKSKAIFNLYESKKRINFNAPRAGDLIFFANTQGKGIKSNKDKKNITHIGIITQVMDDKTIEFAHFTKGKIHHGYMNLSNKNTYRQGKKELNSYVVKCKSGNVSCLSSNRFAGFGRVE